MTITQAILDDVEELAKLVWLDTRDEEPTQQALDGFAADLMHWWKCQRETHAAFVARDSQGQIVGMAWVALGSRVPRPGAPLRFSADIQTVFVLPEHRGHGVGSALIDAAIVHATSAGAGRVTVQSGRTAVPMYERLGFRSSRELLQRLSD